MNHEYLSQDSFPLSQVFLFLFKSDKENSIFILYDTYFDT